MRHSQTDPAMATEKARATSDAEPSPLDDFEIFRVLGKGAYGKVYQVRKMTGTDR